MDILKWWSFVLAICVSMASFSTQALGVDTTLSSPHLSTTPVSTDLFYELRKRPSISCSSITIEISLPTTIRVNSVPPSRISLRPGTGIPDNVTYTTTCVASSLQSSCTIIFTATGQGMGTNNNILYIVGENDGGSTTIPFIINVNI